ncbi:MAG: hypothetical protein GXP45_08645 [bacterium]|nr:hypothetical protein [bacterium]
MIASKTKTVMTIASLFGRKETVKSGDSDETSRLINKLKKIGIHSLEDLQKKEISLYELSQMKGMGNKSVKLFWDTLCSHNLDNPFYLGEKYQTPDKKVSFKSLIYWYYKEQSIPTNDQRPMTFLVRELALKGIRNYNDFKKNKKTRSFVKQFQTDPKIGLSAVKNFEKMIKYFL